MKKKFILAIFGISLLFMACQEYSYYNDYDMRDKNSSILTEAMRLIGDNHDFVTLPNRGKTIKGDNISTRSSNYGSSLRLDQEDFMFDWNNAEVIISNLAEAVIVPIKQNKEMALRSVVAIGNSRKRETTPLYSMLYMRKILKTGQTHAYILSYAPDRDYVNACEENGEELQLFPNPQGSDYSGLLLFSNIYGEISHGIRFERGRKCYYIYPRSEKNRAVIEQTEAVCSHECDSVHSAIKMSLEIIPVTSSTRSTYSNNSEDFSDYICSLCGKGVYECTCVVVEACGVCKKQPCVCDEYIEEEEERCPYCAFLIEFCHCYNMPGQNPSGSLGPSNPLGPTIPPIDPSLPGLGGNTGGSNENDKIPCQSDDGSRGNPLVGMEVSPPNSWNYGGGFYGFTRTRDDGSPKKHHGIDLVAPEGTPIYSTHDGEIKSLRNNHDNSTYSDGLFPEYQRPYMAMGNYIMIESTVNGITFTHIYMHLMKNEDYNFKEEDMVYAGEQIGYSGVTGNASDKYPHLHYEVHVNNKSVDPLDYLAVDTIHNNGKLTNNLKTHCQ